jgi:hypothetical protein
MTLKRSDCLIPIMLPVMMAMMNLPASAQNPVRPVPNNGTVAKPRVEPCWQVAGISKAAIDQRNMVAKETHQQVEEVCANTSLSLQEKRSQIKQIREREKQQTEGLITPEQQSALRACQQERNPAPAHAAHAPTGPCGEALPGHASPGAGDDQKAPDDASKPN